VDRDLPAYSKGQAKDNGTPCTCANGVGGGEAAQTNGCAGRTMSKTTMDSGRGQPCLWWSQGCSIHCKTCLTANISGVIRTAPVVGLPPHADKAGFGISYCTQVRRLLVMLLLMLLLLLLLLLLPPPLLPPLVLVLPLPLPPPLPPPPPTLTARAQTMAKPWTLPRHAWTMNVDAVEGSVEDRYRFNPWRAPGSAPVVDACGQAGGKYEQVHI